MAAVLTVPGPSKSLKRLVTERLREKMVKKVEERFDQMIDAQLDSAIGVTTESYDKKSGDLIYNDVAPNHNAAKLLLEYVIEKPSQKIEHQGAIGIVHLIKQLDTVDDGTDNED